MVKKFLDRQKFAGMQASVNNSNCGILLRKNSLVELVKPGTKK